MPNYAHKKLLCLTDIYADTVGVVWAKLIDPAKKPNKLGYVVNEGKLINILEFASTYGYLIAGVRRQDCHIAILSGHGSIGQIGCMESPTDGDMLHALREDPGVLLMVIDKTNCAACNDD